MIQPVFCPTQEMLEVNIRSIHSILDYFHEFVSCRPHYVLGGYCKNDDFWKQIELAVADRNTLMEVHVHRYDGNLGKAFIVNDLFDKYDGARYGFLFSMDSDIILDSTVPNILERSMKIFRRFGMFGRLGLIAYEQNRASQHIKSSSMEKRVVGGESLLISHKGLGVAGGCLFIPTKIFAEVGMYRIMGTYGGIDGYLMKDLVGKRYKVAIVESISVIHPEDSDLSGGEYTRWKTKMRQARREKNGARITFDELRSIAAETDVLWEDGFQPPGRRSE